ncbi:hypothetical protein BX285_1428 [Streptomyces sp. 1114.5]|uniref:DUF6039 family protein n=1 Tax=unclassified Streptomyces TaxID=2593676 RepID=UPI000BD978B7|nr:MULTISPECIES: DUF6039 family protein [unclassified Streptomyces]RKT17064.1 hypothetical protein BX285_1428 [Streptomyces sp. 1114.5]SOB83275.1 hypothetical protein SAMN06272789_3477 [Streptomyces sp. 1331.2]
MAPMTDERRAQIVPPAAHQCEIPAEQLLHTGNAGVVVQKVGQLKSEFRNEGRMFAREVAKHVNARQAGNATAFVYEESFGYEDRIHFLIHLRSLDTYYDLVEMGDQDRAYRESIAKERVQEDTGGGAWDRLFVDGSVRSNVLLPWAGQSEQPLNSANSGIVLLRSTRIGHGFRAEGRELAEEITTSVNKEFAGQASVTLFDEAFGDGDQVHWLVGLQDLTVYGRLRQALAAEGRPGTFVDGSARETALTPHHWGLYATRQGQ